MSSILRQCFTFADLCFAFHVSYYLTPSVGFEHFIFALFLHLGSNRTPKHRKKNSGSLSFHQLAITNEIFWFQTKLIAANQWCPFLESVSFHPRIFSFPTIHLSPLHTCFQLPSPINRVPHTLSIDSTILPLQPLIPKSADHLPAPHPFLSEKQRIDPTVRRDSAVHSDWRAPSPAFSAFLACGTHESCGLSLT